MSKSSKSRPKRTQMHPKRTPESFQDQRCDQRHPEKVSRGGACAPEGFLSFGWVTAGNNNCRQTSKWWHSSGLPGFDLSRNKTLGITGNERLYNRMFRHLSLKYHPARPVGPTCPPGNLKQQLISAFSSTQVPASEAKISINHTDQGE